MFIVFEGIDGSGKTTLSNLVAKQLRKRGLRVEHVREGGRFASTVTQAMRELGRDARNLALTPRAELMLYLAREVQLFDEATRPALDRADIVIADRFVSTAEVLAVFGRGLPPGEVAPLVAAAVGVVPELSVLVDVDPAVARARRRVAKQLGRDRRPPSRKGLAGPALQHRLREGYRAIADRDAARWIVIDNTDADLEALVNALAEVAAIAHAEGAAVARARVPSLALPPVLAARDRAAALAALMAWVDRRAPHEPGLAAYFLDGLAGPEIDERRRALAERVPIVIATGLRWLDDPVSWQLRHRLAEAAPGEVARSIVGAAALHRDADALLGVLLPAAPHQVGEALAGRGDPPAWQLRAQLPPDALLVSLAGVDGERAWSERERLLAERGGLARITEVAGATLACASVTGLAGDRAWEIREALREVAPVAALDATLGLVDERAWLWRWRDLDRAPKVVMRTLAGVADDRAWELRDRVAARCEEAFDSIAGLDDPRSWRFRDTWLDTWPAAVARSLGPLAGTDPGRALLDAALARHPTNVALWRYALRSGRAG